jgi:hypothetical protein
MSAMKVLNETRDKGGKICLNLLWGLVAPESDTICGIINSLGLPEMLCLPVMRYSPFIQEGAYNTYIYCNLFRRTESEVEGYGRFEGIQIEIH